jgi:hypothetical protein
MIRIHYLATLLLAASYLGAQPGHAQRAAVAPLAPLPPVAPPRLGVPLTRRAPAASSSEARPEPVRIYKPVYLLNSHIVIGDSLFRSLNLNPNKIKEIMVYKGGNMPVQWRSLAEHGVIDITLPASFKPKTKSLAAIKRQLKLKGPARFELDELPLQDMTLRVATIDIAGLDVTPPAAAGGSTVVNIRLVRLKPKPHAYPPGTIFIRGISSL